MRRTASWPAVLMLVLIAAGCGGSSDRRVGRPPAGDALFRRGAVTATGATPTPVARAITSTGTATPGPLLTPASAMPAPQPARFSITASAGQGRSAGRASAEAGPATAIYRGNPNRRAVALTFDAGADRGNAEAILDVLRDNGVRASFAITGVWAEQNPDLVQRMAAEGHRLINHTYDHSSFTGLSTNRRPLTTEQRWAELDRAEQIIFDLTGQSTLPLFRAPYGDTDDSVLRDIGARGYPFNILWTVDSGGWQRISAGAIIRRCLRQAVPGAIYVMHVGAESQDGPALPAIIAGLRDAGYSFETVDEILE